MAMKYMTNLDLQQNQLLNVVIQNLATDPANPKDGQIWYNTTSKLIKYKDTTGVQSFVSVAAQSSVLEDYQDKIEATGLLKGDGNGGVSTAVAGTDYQAVIDVTTGVILKSDGKGSVVGAVAGTDFSYAVLNGTSDPTATTAGSVNQLYVNTTKKRLFVCTAVADGSFTWLELTTDISSKQDLIDVTTGAILKQGTTAGDVVAATAGTDYAYAELTGTTAPESITVGAIGQHYLDTTAKVEYVCVAIDGSAYTWERVTVDISGKQDVIDATHKLAASLVSGLAEVATSGSYNDLSDTPDIPEASDDTPNMDGTASAGTADTWSRSDHVHPTDTTRQSKITATGLLKGDGNGGVTAATAGTDYSAPIEVDADKALVSDSDGHVSASSVTATELGYLSGATGNIQSQIDDIPKYTYKNAVEATVADGATQSEINTAAIAAITTAYSTATKWDAVVVAVTFTPSDKVKDAVYYYNGTNWVFLYYVTTGIQLANGTTAGLIQEADSDSDLTLAGGVATVNKATKLRTARTITLTGVTATGQLFDGSQNIEIPITAIPANLLTDEVAVANGGTGKSSITEGAVLVGNADGEFDEVQTTDEVTEDSEALVTSGAVYAALASQEQASVHKYVVTNPQLTGVSGTCTWTVNHKLNTRAVTVSIFETASPFSQIMADVEVTDLNNVTISLVSDAIASGTFQVTVVG